MSSGKKPFTMNDIPNIADRNVSPNAPPSKLLNLPNAENPFFGLNYGRTLYELDYLLRQNIQLLTGARRRVYKGLHLVCDNERETCKYKILDKEIEARGDCFFHAALYNIGKKYFGPRGTSREEIDNMINAQKFREFLVDYYVKHTGNVSALEFRPRLSNADSRMVQAYAHKFNRNVCVFTIRDEAAFDPGQQRYDLSVELFINKNALREKVDFLILTQAPEHYTTLKRIPGFKTTTIMNRFLDYVYTYENVPSVKNGKKQLPIREDIYIQHDKTEATGRFEDTIRTYMIIGVKNVYRLFQTPYPDFVALEDLPEAEPEGSPTLSPNTLAGLSEQEQLDYIIKKTAKGSNVLKSKPTKAKSHRESPKANASNVSAPFGTVLGVTWYHGNKPVDSRARSPRHAPKHEPLAPLRPLSDFEPPYEEPPYETRGVGQIMMNRSHSPDHRPDNAHLKPGESAPEESAISKEDLAKQMFARARDMSPYTAAQLKNHFNYSPGTNRRSSLKPRPKARTRTPRPSPRPSPKPAPRPAPRPAPKPRPKTKTPASRASESISNADIAQLLATHSPKTVEQITGKKLSGLDKPKKDESISNADIAQLLTIHSPKTVEEITGKKLSGITRKPAPRSPRAPKNPSAPRNPNRFANLPNNGTRRIRPKPSKRLPNPLPPAFANSPKFMRRNRSRSPARARNLAGNEPVARPGFFSMFGMPRFLSKKKK